jgi:DNA repair protein RadA/Sms
MKSVNFKEIKISKEPTLKTGIKVFDKWFSNEGGMVLPSAIFLTGSSGAGKTTLMINLMKWLKGTITSIYLREMTKESVKGQTKNIVFDHDNAFVSDKSTCNTFEEYLKELDEIKPKVVIIDSLQAIAMEDYAHLSLEEACNFISSTLRDWINKNNAVLFLVGHVTKDDTFAGRNTIMQFMDGHVEMIFHKKEGYRTIAWGQKNRKGPMGTLYYTFGEKGIEFFTEEEWEEKNKPEKKSFLNCISSSIGNYFEKIDNKKPNYKDFLKEFNKESSKIEKNYNEEKISGLEFVLEYIKLMNGLEEKYNL